MHILPQFVHAIWTGRPRPTQRFRVVTLDKRTKKPVIPNDGTPYVRNGTIVDGNLADGRLSRREWRALMKSERRYQKDQARRLRRQERAA